MPRPSQTTQPPAPPPKTSNNTRSRTLNTPARYPNSHPVDPAPYDSRDPALARGDLAARSRIQRSQTSGITSNQAKMQPPLASRRSHSQDNVTQTANAVEKARKAGKPATKEGSTHADVIDMMDFTGMGSMFHHDGPFDACAPSRNRHKNKAPMLAWSGAPGDPNGPPAEAAKSPSGGRRFHFGFGNDPNKSPPVDSRYPTLPYNGGVTEEPETISKKSKAKEVDRIAEAWGIHEPEPYEEFSAGGTTNGSRFNSTSNGSDYMDRVREASHRDHRPPMAKRLPTRTNLPPPQPIFPPDPSEFVQNGEPEPGTPSSPSWYAGDQRPGAPKRSLSIMNRVRRMRENPNVPVSADNTEETYVEESEMEKVEGGQQNYSSSAEGHGQRTGRANHRTQNSNGNGNGFFGRFARSVTSHERVPQTQEVRNGRERSKTTGGGPQPTSDSYVLVEDNRNNTRGGALPNSPVSASGSPPSSPNGGGGLFGRKNTIMKKMKGVVKNGTSL